MDVATALGCYGFLVRGLETAAPWLAPAPDDAHTLHVTRHVGRPDVPREDELTFARAHLRLADHESVATVERATASVTLTTVRDYPDEQILHPFVSGCAAVMSRWLGRDPFHAGGFRSGGAAWIVLGDKGLGKSTLLAALDVAGLPTVSDDLIVVQDGEVYGGPGFIDLRADAARRLDVGVPIGRVGARDRHRYYLGAREFSYPLGGWIGLRWGDEVDVTAVDLRERLTHLYNNSAVRRAPVNPASFLRHVARPFYLLTRPRNWQSLDHSVAALREVTS